MLLFALLMASCGSADTPMPGGSTPEVVKAPTAAPTKTPVDERTTVEVEEAPSSGRDMPVAIGQQALDPCLACHTDKQRLLDTTAPLEEVVSESSGEG